jgi:CHAT domain-containing protein
LRQTGIVLSACETAVGKTNEGKKELRIWRALLVAGRKVLFAGTWMVDDRATATMMAQMIPTSGGEGV